MLIIKKANFLKMRENDIKLVKGNIFIYPTDTIYGIGCNAENAELVAKLREIKGADHPFSVIAPSKEWVIENLECKDEWLEKLPGPVTLILKIKTKGCVADETTAGKNTLGVRIPDHWFSEVAKDLNLPIITTSVNESGEEPITHLDEIPENIKKHTHFAIDEGRLEARPSTIIDCTGDEPKTIER